MTDDDLTPFARAALDELRASRGPCPTADVLVEYERLADEPRAAHPHHGHIQTCSRCQLALLHMREPAAAVVAGVNDGRRFKLAFVLPVAAAAVLAVGLSLVFNRDGDRSGPPGEPAGTTTVRGTELQLIAPAGAVESIREFSWQSPIRAERYRVIVRRGSTVVWQAETTGLSVAPPQPGVLQRDVQYEWQVEAIDREGHVRMTSPPQPFVNY